MIIGISGKIGSGKDTVAKIIQWLTAKDHEKWPQELQGSFNTLSFYETDWKIKKFAGKLKQIISLLTGISLADLEREEVKNSLLPDSWQIWRIFNWGREGIIFYTEKQAIDFCNTNSTSQTNFTYKKSARTYRWLLQHVGTELFRDMLHENVHINALFADYKKYHDGYNIPENKEKFGEYPKWLITDLRFPNELDAVEERDGITIRVNRLKYKYIDGICVPIQKVPMEERDKYLAGVSNSNEHPSETGLDNAKFKYTIENNGTIEDLIEKVREILILEKIL